MKKRMILVFISLIAVVFGIYHITFSSYAGSTNRVDDMSDQGVEGIDIATFAGGCFWCSESDFEKVDGVTEAVSGYTGGLKENPTYKDVSYGKTDHMEGVQVYYDPEIISYKTLLDVFWRHINPTDSQGQFVDRGPQYRTAIFYHTKEQKKMAEDSMKKLIQSGKFSKPIVT